VYLGVDPRKAIEAIRAVIAEMNRLSEQDLTDEELVRAKEFTKGRLRLDLETTNGVAFWLTYQELLLGEIRSIEDELKVVDAITAADVRRVAGSVLREPMQMAVIGPFTKESGFRSAIEA
jgi:predicted Zn-dependent peptidase